MNERMMSNRTITKYLRTASCRRALKYSSSNLLCTYHRRSQFLRQEDSGQSPSSPTNFRAQRRGSVTTSVREKNCMSTIFYQKQCCIQAYESSKTPTYTYLWITKAGPAMSTTLYHEGLHSSSLGSCKK